MKRKQILLSILLLTILLSGNPTVRAAPPEQSGTITQSFGDPNGTYLEVTFSGTDFYKSESMRNFYWGDYSGGTITFSGTARATVAEGMAMYVNVHTYLGDETQDWPPPGEESRVSGATIEFPFSFSFTPSSDYGLGYIVGGAEMNFGGEYNVSTYRIGFQVNFPPESLPPADTSADPDTWNEPDSWEEPGNVTPPEPNSNNIVTVIAVVIGGLLILGVIGAGGVSAVWLIRRRKPALPARSSPAEDAWEQVAKEADAEAEKYIQQWETVRESADPNDPGYHDLQKKYEAYIQDQRQRAAEARRKAQEIAEDERQYQQELREQQAYRQHRQAESEFIERESQRQARRQGAFDRQLDQMWREQQQKLKELEAKRKKYRDSWRKFIIESNQRIDSARANALIANSQVPAFFERNLIDAKKKADCAISVIAAIAPETKPVKVVYKYFAGVGEGIGEGIADPENFWEHVDKGQQKGTIDGGLDLIKDKFLGFIPKPKNPMPLSPNTQLNTVDSDKVTEGILRYLLSKERDKKNPVVWLGKWLKKKIGS